MKPLLLMLLFLPGTLEAGENRVHVVLPAGDLSEYWTRWRGPTGQGLVLDKEEYPDTWSGKDNVLWKTAVPGEGNSSPIVYKDRIFLTAAYERGKKRSILGFDRSTGKSLWETVVPAGTPEAAYGKNGWASGTPATDGQRVVAYFGNMGVFCVDTAGKELWHALLGEIKPPHGAACSPLLLKDRVVVFQDQDTGSFVVALDKLTGKELWKTKRSETVGWGSPIALSVDGNEQIVVSSQQRVYGYDAETGKEVWTCDGNTVEVTPTPVVGHGMLFCCSGRAGPTLAIRPDGTGNLNKNGKLVWKTTKGAPFVPSPLLYGDYLYMVNDNTSVVTCLAAKTGKVIWQERCGESRESGFSASPIGVNDKVFFTNNEGETFVLVAGPKFELLHVNRLGERTFASPALVDGKWYLRSQRHLWCIGRK